MSSIIIGLLIDSKPSFGEIPHKNAAQKNGIKHKITFFNAHLVLVGQSAISTERLLTLVADTPLVSQGLSLF